MRTSWDTTRIQPTSRRSSSWLVWRNCEARSFWRFANGLLDDRVLIIKDATNSTTPMLQEAVLLSNLAGEAVLVNLQSVSAMSEDCCRKDEYRLDLGALWGWMEPSRLWIRFQIWQSSVNGCTVQMEEEDYVEVMHWHPVLGEEHCASLRHVYTERFEQLVAPLKVSSTRWIWREELKTQRGNNGSAGHFG